MKELLTGQCLKVCKIFLKDIDIFSVERNLGYVKLCKLIEFFDNVEYEQSTLWEYGFESIYSNTPMGTKFDEIIREAIKECNEIYNEEF